MTRVCWLVVFVILAAGCSVQGAPASTVPTTVVTVPVTASSTTPTTVASSTSLVPPTTAPVGSELITATGKPVPTFISDEHFYCGFLGDKIYLRRDYDYFAKAHPVIAAVVIGDMDELARLLDGGGDPNDLDEPYAVSALTGAIQSDCDEAIDLLLKHGADPNLAAAGDYTPVMWAVKRHNRELLQRLVDTGADVNVFKAAQEDAVAISLAVTERDLESMQILVEAGADVDVVSMGSTPLQAAVGADWMEGVGFLVEAGADTTETVLRTSSEDNRDLVLLRYLLEHGASPEYMSDWATGPGGPCQGSNTLTACFDAIWPEGAAILRDYGG